MIMHKPELLAPAGNRDCLIAAVQSGADAVYLAGKSFGARSYADNFDRDGLLGAADYCHLRGVKLYVTVNTLVADSELDEIQDYLLFLNEIGTDAIIVQDLAVAATAARIVPELPIHASTQLTVHNSSGVRALSRFGVKRVVLSRELSCEDIAAISRKCDAELEVFAHGALCMSYSGQCLMSSIIGCRSGNRGRCAQPCRLPYTVGKKEKKAFFMSLKDLSCAEHIDALSRAGVESLKIEGRMKGAAYVAAVVGIYRKYIDSPQSVTDEDLRLLDGIFNRGGLTDGYITGKTGKNMFAFNKPENPYRNNENSYIKALNAELKDENVKSALICRAEIAEGERPKLEIEGGGCRLEYIYEKVTERAERAPLANETAIIQLSKLGGTPFEMKECTASITGSPFLSAKDLNAMRRGAVSALEEKILSSRRRENEKPFRKPEEIEECELPLGAKFVCEVTCAEQLKAVRDLDFERLFVPLCIVRKERKCVENIKDRVVIVPPAIVRENELESCTEEIRGLLDEGFCGVCAMNISALESFPAEKLFGGFRLNIFNSRALRELCKAGVPAAELSAELTLKQISALKKSIPVGVMAYGRLPLMLTENCVLKNGGACPCNDSGSVTDRMGMTFPVIRDGGNCRNVVLNCKKTYTADFTEALLKAGVTYFRLYFTDESPEECLRVCNAYMNRTGYRPEDFTRAHFYKGVMQV